MKWAINRRIFHQYISLPNTKPPKMLVWIWLVALSLLPVNLHGGEKGWGMGAQGDEKSYLLRPARVFDAMDGKCQEGWKILVTGNHIAAVGADAQSKASAKTVEIDLPGLTVLRSHFQYQSRAQRALGNERWDSL